MVWWIPTTWGEDLGAARRVSLYSFDYTPDDGIQCTAACRVKLDDGSNVEESLYLPAMPRKEIKSIMREELRKKYTR